MIIPPGGKRISGALFLFLFSLLFLLFFSVLFFNQKIRARSHSCLLDNDYLSDQTAPQTCTAIVDFAEGDTDNSSWFEMWAAAVAVDEMCVTKGKAGAAHGLGELTHSLPVPLKDALLTCRCNVGQNKRLMLSLSP